MIEAGVFILMGFHLDPGFQDVDWRHIVRQVYSSMQEERRLILISTQ